MWVAPRQSASREVRNTQAGQAVTCALPSAAFAWLHAPSAPIGSAIRVHIDAGHYWPRGLLGALKG